MVVLAQRELKGSKHLGRSQNRAQPTIVDPAKFGVSFSLKQCANFEIDFKSTLSFLLDEMGFRRFRLMSYWDEHGEVPGVYDFSKLDEQFDLIEKRGGKITLCLGARQPRWPESHWPKWALDLPEHRRDQKLMEFIEEVVTRYQKRTPLISYQLENEFLNRSFGLRGDFNRKRVQAEYAHIKELDPTRPVIMSTSNTYGIPVRKPRPDMFGFTLYKTQFENGKYTSSKLPRIWWNIRAHTIKLFTGKRSFIHELQAEPWGPKAIWEMTSHEQFNSMSIEQLKRNIQFAMRTKLYPIDLWGGEWWYWRKTHSGDSKIYKTVRNELRS